MFRRVKILLVLFAALSPLTACETTVPDRTFANLTYGNLPRIRLNAGAVKVVSKFRSPMKAPNVEFNFPTPPEKALKQWAGDRLKAVGRSGSARFTIIDARALETPLKMEKGLKRIFTYQQSHRYDVTVEAILEIFDDSGKRLGYATASARRSTTVSEDATLNKREMLWQDMTEKIMNDFNETFEKKIREHLKRWIK